MFFNELFTLISELKLDVPIFSPRYMAHMISETTLPSLVAYFGTLLYNPNNVSSEASPVTIRYELEVGRQFAELFGFEADESFGHLTSGGTIANYESVWYNKAGRLLPVSLEMARRAEGQPPRLTLWEALNVPLEDVEEMLGEWMADGRGSSEERYAELKPFLAATLGDVGFARAAEECFGEPWREPVIIVPRTAHYCWSRAGALLAVGRSRFRTVDVDAEFRMDPDDLSRTMSACLEERTPVLQVVSVVGSTEFGSVDPVGEIVDVRNEMVDEGLYAPIHVDAAYGGYFASMYAPGSLPEAADFHEDPPPDVWVRDAYRSLSRCDSITVDPHKAGYTPYGAGSIVLKHGFLKELVAETAPYVFDRDDTTAASTPTPQLGKFILEGSKPGAAAASVWFSHRLIPLNRDGYGRQLAVLCRLARDFDRMIASQDGLETDMRLRSLFRPHLNIVCIYALPDQADRISQVNALNEELAVHFGVKDVRSIQEYDYLVSRTTVSLDMPNAREDEELAGLEADADRLVVLRLVFMNRWVEGRETTGRTFMADFLSHLSEAARTAWSDLVF
jgi:glutamate/tyrosine decarboxylase-like PLP-dependent enzyme